MRYFVKVNKAKSSQIDPINLLNYFNSLSFIKNLVQLNVEMQSQVFLISMTNGFYSKQLTRLLYQKLAIATIFMLLRQQYANNDFEHNWPMTADPTRHKPPNFIACEILSISFQISICSSSSRLSSTIIFLYKTVFVEMVNEYNYHYSLL